MTLEQRLKYFSVCSGIEAATVAWHEFMDAVAFCEYEAFPSAVLAHHHPTVPNMGDLTKWREWSHELLADADVLVGGTPCQAFSVAGLRNSLADDRGNLSLEFVRLADAIDDVRSAAGRQPAIIVWENVPGVLSVKDNAFGCFLAALAGDVAPYVPPRGKWTDAGVVIGPQRAVAWRILDAQYFGVAQRRRRVFVVASAREGFDPAAVLLECEGVRRDTPPRREAGKGAARGIEIGPSGGRFTDLNPTLDTRAKDGPIRNQLAGAVLASTGDTRGQDPVVAVMEDPVPPLMARSSRGGAQTLSPGWQTDGHMVAVPSTGDISHCLNAGGMGRQDYETETLVAHGFPDPAYALSAGAQGKGGVFGSGRDGQDTFVAHTLKGEGFDASEDGTGRGTPLVAVPLQEVGKRTGVSTDDPRAGIGIGQDGDPMFTLQAGAQHGVAAYAFQPRIARNGRGDMGETVNALNAQSGETGKGDAAPCVAAGMAVRRLTPVECSRLQGFPDDYLLSVTWRGKCPPPDGPMYKALGNSMAVPVMRWIGRRIVSQLEGEI